MTFIDILNTIFEFLLVGGLVWGIFNEQRLIAFERKIKAYFRRKSFKVVKSDHKVWN
ncbi:MAG: hypothetical protein J6B80_05370 [Clostridia bacterium]|nr:hypothetical protein [Clostridia bacterium]